MTQKSVLKQKTQVDVVTTRKRIVDLTCTVIDGCALLWIQHWLAKGNVQDDINIFKEHIGKRLQSSDTYLIFDRYKEYSTKSATRRSRGTWGTHNLTVNTAQKVVLNVTYNKKQLIELICNDLMKYTTFQQKYTKQHKMVFTGQEDNPVEISKGIIITRKDFIYKS